MESTSNSDAGPGRRLATIAIVLAVVAVPFSGVVGAQTSGNQAGNASQVAGNQSYVAVQGEQCTPMAPIRGNESVRTFYDYRIPIPDNPYANTTGEAYGSEGTTDLQRANTSIVFLYADTNGTADTADDTLSLVFVHGNEGNDASAGGSASFNITGLPENGTWAVRDDDYEGESNYDAWFVDANRSRVDWTWGDAATDGGAYEGMTDNATVTVRPAFNERAALFGQYFNGTVDRWEVVSNATENESADVTRTQLNMTEPMVITTQSCADLRGNASQQTDADGLSVNESDLFGTPSENESNPNESAENGTSTPSATPTETETAAETGTENESDILDPESVPATETPANESANETE
ncbi:hypothetical protein [Haloarcula marina]|uniref:hypothetical protein n=1 Tax=Haloarcula marina TaxID=2961574 RepID=UPI0020B6BA5C|nr:hypothetical protein [Halomicroarcula marina]